MKTKSITCTPYPGITFIVYQAGLLCWKFSVNGRPTTQRFWRRAKAVRAARAFSYWMDYSLRPMPDPNSIPQTNIQTEEN